VAPVLRSLADVYFLELRKRTRVSRRAIAIQEKSLPPDNIDLADTLASYALLLTRTKHKTEPAVMKAREPGDPGQKPRRQSGTPDRGCARSRSQRKSFARVRNRIDLTVGCGACSASAFDSASLLPPWVASLPRSCQGHWQAWGLGTQLQNLVLGYRLSKLAMLEQEQATALQSNRRRRPQFPGNRTVFLPRSRPPEASSEGSSFLTARATLSQLLSFPVCNVAGPARKATTPV
jgi:hypothetical protein